MKEYLLTDELNTFEKTLLFKLKMYKVDLNGHFPNKYIDLMWFMCRTPESVENLQPHLDCDFYKQHK